MRQQALVAGTFEHYRKPTRRDLFLAEMDNVIPCENFVKGLIHSLLKA